MKKLLQDVFSNNLYHFQDYLWTRARHKPGSVSDNHLSRHTVAGMLQRPTFRAAAGNCPAKAVRPFWSCSGWGLHETYVTIYPRELLPHDFTLTANAAVCFCCTFPIVTYAGRYPASSPCGARTFLTAHEALRDCLSYPSKNRVSASNFYNVYGFVFASAIITSMSSPFPDALALICLAMFSVKIFSFLV